MADTDKKFVIPCSNPNTIKTAIREAQRMLDQTQTRLRSALVSVPEDDRQWTALQKACVEIFKVQPGLQSMAQVTEIKLRFGFLAQAATRINPVCVTDAHPMAAHGNEMGHTAFASIGNDSAPTIYFLPAFFRSAPPIQARTVVHELAHARVGAAHGAEFLSFELCSGSPLKTFDEAINNAYSYDLFADCASSST